MQSFVDGLVICVPFPFLSLAKYTFGLVLYDLLLTILDLLAILARRCVVICSELVFNPCEGGVHCGFFLRYFDTFLVSILLFVDDNLPIHLFCVFSSFFGAFVRILLS